MRNNAQLLRKIETPERPQTNIPTPHPNVPKNVLKPIILQKRPIRLADPPDPHPKGLFAVVLGVGFLFLC